jgi:hypothetical protein
MLEYMHLTDRQDLTHNDMADPCELNEIIWFSVRGEEPMPNTEHLALFDLLRTGMKLGVENNNAGEE